MFSIKSFLAIITNNFYYFLNKLKLSPSFIGHKTIEANFQIEDIPIKCQIEYFTFNVEYIMDFSGCNPCIFEKNNLKYITGLPSLTRYKITIKSRNNITDDEKIEIIDKNTTPNWKNIIEKMTSF